MEINFIWKLEGDRFYEIQYNDHVEQPFTGWEVDRKLNGEA